ncbi:MAG: HlyD family efflux transporter periplasmic adaptor subunit [Pirellulales bacterium]
MVSLADSLVSSATRPLPVRMRPDLVVRRHRYHGRPFWVVKEPIGLKYFRFQEEEFAILKMLDGQCSYQQIKERFESEFAPQKITLQDLQQFLGMLHRSGLLISNAPGQGLQLKRRRDEQAQRELMGKLANILALRFRGIDPDWLLNRLHPLVAWVFTRWAFCLWLALALSALTLVTVNFDEFQRRMPAFHQFFGPSNWIYLGIVLALTKIIHEFGHGLSCKHYGGECHEMGVMLLVLTPCLYCNVSDSWLLPNKWHRAIIGAAGMYVEIAMASVATWLWWFSTPGLLNHIALSVMFICSVSTVMFNGNPLLRFDGYYILSDLSEIPNLRQKSSRILQRLMSEYCLGLEQQDDPFLPESNHLLFAAYTVAAVAYRWLVVFSILMFLNSVLEPYGLKVIGQVVALASIGGMIFPPLWQFAKFLRVPGRMSQIKRKNVLITVGVAAAALAGVLFIPFPYNVRCGVQLNAEKAQQVSIVVPGRLVELKVKPGDKVEAGQLIARLENEQLVLQQVAIQNQVKTLSDLLTVYHRFGGDDPTMNAQTGAIEESLAGAKELLAQKNDELKKLEIRAPITGTVLPAPSKKADPSEDGRLPTWSGSAFDTENEHAYLSKGDDVCWISPERSNTKAVLIIDQADLGDVHPEQKVKIRLDAFPNSTLVGSVRNVARVKMRVSPEEASTASGGQLITRTDSKGVQRPLRPSFPADVLLDDPEGQLLPGMRGRAKIAAEWRSLGTRVWQFATRTFHFRI